MEICSYEYQKQDFVADARIADVKYEKSCDTDYVHKCKSKRTYGYEKARPVCKEVPQETCINKPNVRNQSIQFIGRDYNNCYFSGHQQRHHGDCQHP